MKRILACILAGMLFITPVVQAEDTEDADPKGYTILKAIKGYMSTMYQFGVTDEDFLDALIKNILKENDSDEAFEFVADSLADALDKHSVYFTPEELEEFNTEVDATFGGVGVTLANIDGYCTIMDILPNTPAQGLGLVPGDKIIAVDGESVIDTDIDLIVSRTRGQVGTEVTLTFQSESGKVWEETIVRDTIVIPSVEYALNSDNDTAYLVITQFANDTGEQFIEKYNEIKEKGINNIIIDLRNNTGGYTDEAIKIASLFLPEGSVIFKEFSRVYNLESPYLSQNPSPDTTTKLVLLINDYTASSSEILTAALKDNNRATVVGTNTFGKGTMQTVASLGSYGGVKVTMAEFVSPNGSTINNVGIAPHYEVENTTRKVTEDDVSKLSFSLKHKLGDQHEEITGIKQRLALMGLYTGDVTSPVFDKELELAVSRFQEAHSLYPYGVADINTQLTIHTAVMCGEMVVDNQLNKAYEILGTNLE